MPSCKQNSTPTQSLPHPLSLHRLPHQVVISNLALLAENGQLLLDGKLPEEFLVPVPMRLSAEEIQELSPEFPDWTPAGRGGLAGAAAADAAADKPRA